jgi:Tfp pilus assembly protein PilF
LTDAQTALTASNPAVALKKLGQAVEIDPKCPDAHLLLGLTEFQSGEVAKSIQHYQVAIKLDPRSYSAHYDLALAYLKQKKLQLARTQLEQAVALDPKQRCLTSMSCRAGSRASRSPSSSATRTCFNSGPAGRFIQSGSRLTRSRTA